MRLASVSSLKPQRARFFATERENENKVAAAESSTQIYHNAPFLAQTHTRTHTPGEPALSPVSIKTQSLALRALRKRKPQETQAIAFEWKPGFSRLLPR